VTPALHDSGRCWKAPGGLFSLKTPGVVTLRFLPPIEAGLDRKEFQRRLDAALEPRFTLGLESAAGEAPASAERSAA
jgi:1-acyl-sn-glycerol-3-phosphate acyltransferase